MSQDRKLIHLRGSADSGVVTEIVMDEDLPTSLPQLTMRLDGQGMAFVERNLPSDSIRVYRHCRSTVYPRFARWQAVACLITLEELNGHTAAYLVVTGIPVGGEVYVVMELIPDSDQDRAIAKYTNDLIRNTIHVWTETVDTQPETVPSGDPGNASLPLSISNLMGTWTGSAYFKVWSGPATFHTEQIPVTITFSTGARYSYSAQAKNWGSRHSGTFTLTPIPHVLNAYEYTHEIQFNPSAGDDLVPSKYRVRLENMTGALALRLSLRKPPAWRLGAGTVSSKAEVSV